MRQQPNHEAENFVTNAKRKNGCFLKVFTLAFAFGALAYILGLWGLGSPVPFTSGMASVALMVGMPSLMFFGYLIAALFGSEHEDRVRAKLQSRFPDQPWRWKPAWNEEHLVAEVSSPWALWYPAFVALPPAVVATSRLIGPMNPEGAKVFMLLFPVAEIILASAAVYASIEWLRADRASCTPESIPVRPGSEFRATIRTCRQLKEQETVRVHLCCQRLLNSRADDGAGMVVRTELWSSATRAIPERHGTEAHISVCIRIPTECEPSTPDGSRVNPRIVWDLSVEFDSRKSSPALKFVVPVFDASKSASN